MRSLVSICFFAAAFIAAPSAQIRADDKVEFDGAISASNLVRVARERGDESKETAVQGRAALMPHLSPQTIGPRSASIANKRTLGSVLGPFQPRILESQPYKSAQALLDPVGHLPPDAQAPLQEEWKSIGSVRADLLDRARALDDADGKLYDDGVKLNDETTRLRKRIDDFNTDVGNYNQQCAGRPPNQACDAWLARIELARTKLSRDIKDHNIAIDAWNARYNDLSVQAASQSKKVDEWEALIKAFIAHANAALECRKLDRIEVQPPQKNVPTGGFELPLQAKTFFETAPAGAPACPVDLLWTMTTKPDVPNTVIGVLSANGMTATFRSGNFTGLATIVCQDMNSGKGTASLLTVFNPTAR